MSLDDLAKQSPALYSTSQGSHIGVGTIFDKNQPQSPYNWIKSEEKMGIIKGPIRDISQNLLNQSRYLEYGKALFQGSSDATTIDNAGQPLGNRYFVAASGKKCMSVPDNKIVDQYYVIDGMASPPGSGENTKGLAFSAAATIQSLDSKNVAQFYTENGTDSIKINTPNDSIDYNTCKRVVLTTDGKGSIDTNYVSVKDANDLIASKIAKEAFHGGGGEHLQKPNIVYGHTQSRFGGGVSMTDFGGYIIGADITDYGNKNIQPQNIVMIDRPIPIHHSVSHDRIYDGDDHKRIWIREQPQNEKSIVTGFFLGSMTVLGIYIVFRLMDRSAASRFR